MSTLKTSNIQHASAASAAITLDANGQATLNGLAYPTSGSLSGRNRIINGDMRIDQRNAGASVTPGSGSTYTLDRWKNYNSQASKVSIQQNAGAVTPPAGYTSYLGVTSLSAYSVTSTDEFDLYQLIEGYNASDLAWGTANARTVTLSFWVRSSLTGTFGGSIQNSGGTRNYPFSYAISAANTWEQKSITISGDTSGTWLTTNGLGISVLFSLGAGSTLLGTANAWSGTGAVGVTGQVNIVGTNGATFYITGVQLEQGSTATPFERRSYGQELSLCQRYYYRATSNGAASDLSGIGSAATTTVARIQTMFPVEMRVPPTSVEQTGTAADYTVRTLNTPVTCSAVPSFWNATTQNATTNLTVASGLVAGNGCTTRTGTSGSAFLGWSAEL